MEKNLAKLLSKLVPIFAQKVAKLALIFFTLVLQKWSHIKAKVFTEKIANIQ